MSGGFLAESTDIKIPPYLIDADGGGRNIEIDFVCFRMDAEKPCK